MKVPRVSWAAVGHVRIPGRYMFKFGWVTISEEDLAVWKNYPEATFALYEAPAQDGEFRLGSFDLEPELDRDQRGSAVPLQPELAEPQDDRGGQQDDRREERSDDTA